MTARPSEIKALVPLLERNWETPEELAKALINTLDKQRADRKTYIGVVEFPLGSAHPTKAWYIAVGPYPGAKTAAKAALQVSGGPRLARGVATMPLISPEGLEKRLKELDEPPKKKGA